MADLKPASENTRRQFLKQTSVLAGATFVATQTGIPAVHADGSDVLKVGLIGCGGRGNGAAVNATRDQNRAVLTAMCDLFPDRLEASKKNLREGLKEKFQVDDDHCFCGFDGYKQLLETDVDVVLLCTPPHFRPEQLAASVKAGKHIFCEKPIAVDPVGVRSVLETCQEAEARKLNIVSGLCWRYDKGVQETVARVRDGAIGDIVAIHENYLTGTLWHRGQRENWSEMETQCRNWLYYTWLSGDHIVEQFIHSLDKALWLKGDEPPVVAFGVGGRQVRTDPKFGNIYDHFSVCYEWADGTKCFAYTRQIAGVFNQTEDFVLGTKGRAQILRHLIEGEESKWRYRGKGDPWMYDAEHYALFDAIRSGKPINNGKYMSYSTLMAILGREVCYTGQKLTWETVFNSSQKLGPDKYEWGPGVKSEIAMPGVTRFA